MTPKEALNELGRRLASVDTSSTIEEDHDDVFPIIRNAITELEELKRYPTADEVCKVLSDYFGNKILYQQKEKTFSYIGGQLVYQSSFDNNKIVVNSIAYSPCLITLIGRFYEGLEKVGKEE